MKFHVLFPLTLILMLGFSCSRDDRPDKQAEEIQSLRQDVASLRNELTQIKQAVTDIHRTVVVERQAQAPAAANQALPDINITQTDIVVGNPDAPLVIVEYSDYQCPYCVRFNKDTFVKIKSTYIDSGKARYIFKDFPLDFHDQAKPAAIASRCAHKQGKFMAVHNALFKDYRVLSDEKIRDIALTQGLNIEQFDRCLLSKSIAVDVEQDFTSAAEIGVTGTPTFVIGQYYVSGGQAKIKNAVRLVGAQPFSAFEKEFNQQLVN